VALKVPERGAIILTAHCVLAMFMMGLGYAIAFYIQQAFFWVPILFAISMIVSLYTKPARARLLLLLLAPLVMLLGAGYIIGAAFGIELISVSFFLALGLVLDLGLYFASDSLILSASGARILDEAESPRCYGIVKALAGKAGVPPPRLGLVATEVPNLFTVGRSPSRAVIALTEGLLDRMSDGELEVLMAHEIFHIKERDMLPMTLAATVAYPIGKLAKPIIFDEGQGRNPLVWVLLIVAAPFVAFLLHLSTPRARERRADEGAAASTGKREVLAAVLERMEETADHKTIDVNPATEPLFAVNPFRGEWLVALFTTHPPAEERIGLLMKGVVKKTDREKAGEAGRQAPRQPAPQQAAPQQPGPAPQAPQNPASASTGQSNGAPAEG
jgi:heat shock protein HtpX